MKRHPLRVVRQAMLGALALVAWASILRGEDEAAHEPPRPLPTVPSVYLRVPYGGRAALLSPTQVDEDASAVLNVPHVQPSEDAAPTAPQPLPIPQPPRASELWLVSTRRLPQAGALLATPVFSPDVARFVWGRGWTPSSLDEFVASTPAGALTTVFVHGNDTDEENALRGGCGLFDKLFADPAAPAPLTRFVIWSWPNESTTLRVRKTAQANAQRVPVEGYFLANFLDRAGRTSATSVAGYSSGTGVVTGALHLLGGGTLEGRVLTTAKAQPRKTLHAVLLGAAMPNHWLLPGQLHERAVFQVERLVTTVNPADAVLRWYPYLWGRSGPAALGSTGISQVSLFGPEQAKIAQPNLEASLNTRHGWRYYSGSPQVIQLLRQELLLAPAARVQSITAMARQPR